METESDQPHEAIPDHPTGGGVGRTVKAGGDRAVTVSRTPPTRPSKRWRATAMGESCEACGTAFWFVRRVL
jgi:hypothetical protein